MVSDKSDEGSELASPDEIAQIMSEIEKMEEQGGNPMDEFREGAGSDGGMEEAIGGLKEDAPASGASLLDAPTPLRAVAPASAGEESPEGSLSLTLSGSMTLRLKYEYNGQDVTIRFVDQCLRVELSDGTEFKIPVARTGGARTGRRAA